MMFKGLKIFFTLLVPTLLCGCNKDVPESQTGNYEINFVPVSSVKSVKSGVEGIIQTSEFPKDRSFAVNAFRLNLDASGNPTLTGGYIFMNMETVAFSTADSLWHTAGHHYWPLSGCLYSLAYYPSPAALISHKMLEGIRADWTGNLYFDGVNIKHTDAENNPITDDALKTDENLTHATVDFMTAESTVDDVQKRTSNSVPITFTHTLSQLSFTIETERDYSSHTYFETVRDTAWYWTSWRQFWLDEIKLSNVYSKGTYSFSAPHWPSTTMSERYTYYPLRRISREGTKLLYKTGESGSPRDTLTDIASFGSRIPVQTPVNIDGKRLCILLLPQRFPDNATIDVSLCVRTSNMLLPEGDTSFTNHLMNDDIVTLKKTFYLKNILPLLSAGTSVNVRFIVSLDEISCSVDYGDWNENKERELVI